MQIPRWLAALFAGAAAAGLATGWRARDALPWRILRGAHVASTLAYLVLGTMDLAEHLRLERDATGHALRWAVVPASESVLHAGVIASNLSLLFARPFRRRTHLLDVWFGIAPAVFLALGCADELLFHRKRVPHREAVIHGAQHLVEGILWATTYATRVARQS